MNTKRRLRCFALWLVLLFAVVWAAGTAGARQVEVKTIADLQSAVSRARPGDVILLADGMYDGKRCALSATGSVSNPILIQARTPGKAVLLQPISVKGSHLAIVGLRFEGNSPVEINGRGIRMSRCAMADVQAGVWVHVRAGSRNVEIDHCRFENKTINKRKSGQLMKMTVRNEQERHHIHHNHFRDVPQGRGNGFETIQLITERNPFDPPPGVCGTVIEKNLFERCNGEAEIISVKSHGNVICHNTFRACRGAVVLRHGHDNTVMGNWFFGDGEAGSGGVRIQGTGQLIAQNYFHGLGAFGVAMMDGTADKLYVRVERARVVFNTFVRCRNALLVGMNHPKYPNGTVPKECLVAANIFCSASDGSPAGKSLGPIVQLVQGDQPEAWKWFDNIASGELGIPETDGIRVGDPRLRFSANGLAFPSGDTPVAKGPFPGIQSVEKDLLGVPRGKSKTIGAVQFPVASSMAGPLAEQWTGPHAVEQPAR